MTKIHTIFLVEDHPLMRRVLRRLLEAEPDFKVIAEAESAELALTQLEHLKPDLVLTDLSLPGASGLELVRVLARQRPELRCLVVTGHVENSYLVAAGAAGAVGLVIKDEPDEVLEAVRLALSSA